MVTTPTCCECGAAIPRNAPGGICPHCLLKQGLTETASFCASPGSRFTPLPIEMVTALFPQLEVIELLGHGGMGAVYKARQKSLNRFVAVKLLPVELVADTQFAERFRKEARTLASLNHPNIVTIYDFGETGEVCYFIMEFVEGNDLRRLISSDAQRLYYRVTGIPYNAVRPPDVRGLRGNLLGSLINANEFDFGQGGDVVAARVRGLVLAQSQIDADVDVDSCTGYAEWTLVFRNDSNVQREARAQVALPPGGVVSRLTLWINDEEREAAFGARNTVRTAYKKVVQRRRDPVLVTTSGRDRILVQCFPVPPDGGTMKTRIGVTFPLVLASHERALFRLPFFVERNFRIPASGSYEMRVQTGPGKLPTSARIVPGHAAVCCSSLSETNRCLHGTLKKAAMTGPVAVRLQRTGQVRDAWTEECRGERDHVICQSIVETPERDCERVVIVIDGSCRMARHRETIARFVSMLADHLRICVIVAKDEVKESHAWAGADERDRARLVRLIMGTDFEGGRDNVPALKSALTIADRADDVVLWLHAGQPVVLSAVDRLVREWRDHPAAPQLCVMQLAPGPASMAQELDEAAVATVIPCFGDVRADLGRLLALLSGSAGKLEFERRCLPPGAAEPLDPAEHASSHLARLWAHTKVLDLSGPGEEADRESAVTMAMDYQLVTPVSGAVVLETKQQYEEAGLTAVDPESAPGLTMTPEPSTWSLMVVGVIVVCFARARRKGLIGIIMGGS